MMKQFKPALLVFTGLTFFALISIISCNDDSKKSEPATETVAPADTPATATPAVIDTLLDTLTTRPVKTPN